MVIVTKKQIVTCKLLFVLFFEVFTYRYIYLVSVSHILNVSISFQTLSILELEDIRLHGTFPNGTEYS